MPQEFVISLAQETILATLLITSPLLLLSLLVGLGISVFQATTQIQEPTLTFVPKIVAVFLGLLILGSWMLNNLLQFTKEIFARLATF
ncbi:MAG: flagellar biosynthesis protein FliQ [Firmicutes bacterium]|nr:flagellar biosynthesis protein FliQ [Bacillota bacterium]